MDFLSTRLIATASSTPCFEGNPGFWMRIVLRLGELARSRSQPQLSVLPDAGLYQD